MVMIMGRKKIFNVHLVDPHLELEAQGAGLSPEPTTREHEENAKLARLAELAPTASGKLT